MSLKFQGHTQRLTRFRVCIVRYTVQLESRQIRQTEKKKKCKRIFTCETQYLMLFLYLPLLALNESLRKVHVAVKLFVMIPELI